MAISVRMDPLLEKELELTAKRQGITKSQFIIDAVERALGRKNPYELMISLQAEEERAGYAVGKAFKDEEQPYRTDAARRTLVKKLKEKHRAGGAG
jgi:predicted DNA-binding protein